jgi:hypothetical protein
LVTKIYRLVNLKFNLLKINKQKNESKLTSYTFRNYDFVLLAVHLQPNGLAKVCVCFKKICFLLTCLLVFSKYRKICCSDYEHTD